MNIPDSVLVDMVANHLMRTPGVEMVASQDFRDGFSYTAYVVIDGHDTVELGPWMVRWSINSIGYKLSVIMQDCDESAVDGCFVTEQEGRRQGLFTNRREWAESCGGFGDRFQREIVLAILTDGEFHAETPEHLKDYQQRYGQKEVESAGEVC